MSLIRYNPAHTPNFFGNFDSFFSSPRRYYSEDSGSWTPHTDVVETDKAYELEVELPGVEKGDIELSVKEGVLTLSGERSAGEERKGENYHITERSFGKFVRSFRLSDSVESDTVSAKFKDGVLRVSVPKKEVQEPGTTKIAIK